MQWFYLFIAGILETFWAVCLKYSQGFTRVWPSILTAAGMVRQLMLHNYESFFLCVLTLLLLYVPSWVQVELRIELPPPLEITVLCFIFASEILGEINAFFIVIPFWDTILHTLNGFLAAAVGFSMSSITSASAARKTVNIFLSSRPSGSPSGKVGASA